MKMISICIITKNEEKNLEQCLRPLAKLNYEIVVVDTGSTDNSVATAKKYTNQVYHFEWCDDFSAARNFSISKASGDIIVVIDSDEFIVEFDKETVEKIFEQNKRVIGRINIKEKFGAKGEFEAVDHINRVFSKRYYHYVGRIHEQVGAIVNDTNTVRQCNRCNAFNNSVVDYEIVNLPITVLHNGYGGEELRLRKAERNIDLLNKELEISEDTYILYQLGKSYYMISNYQKACEYFSKGLEYDINPELEYVIDMVETYGYSLINTKQYKTALQFENIYDQFGNTADFQFLMGLIYMNNEMFEKAIEEFEKAIRCKYSRVIGVNSYLAWYNIGVILECLEYKDDAIMYYKKCGSYEKALERLTFFDSKNK
ncbi:glycosyltransferase [[Clostridium] fimetarium]|uniref:Glycosyltransferase involved in cell wall bisynthesis n=1 Tax=[Clostridium] fimetarium TaxID=99656 RepID=A0A1I0P4T0_9FIRM|nr:glycosyltransferase [[Clostridium] fimetarium]SEW09044.1 Glycosyltransferase involved in cell wall bisynthesis [[Clostridium] fimetarium]